MPVIVGLFMIMREAGISWAALMAVVALLTASCGNGDPIDVVAGPDASNPACQPDDNVPATGIPPSDNDLRHEDIIELLTGERQTGDLDPVEETINDPGFGGVWGDFQGGIVVAVLDCTAVDANELARIAGGPQYLHLIEVPYTFKQVTGFRDHLIQELSELGVDADVPIDSTLTGRQIRVLVLDVEALPTNFGAGVSTGTFTVIEVEGLSTGDDEDDDDPDAGNLPPETARQEVDRLSCARGFVLEQRQPDIGQTPEEIAQTISPAVVTVEPGRPLWWWGYDADNKVVVGVALRDAPGADYQVFSCER